MSAIGCGLLLSLVVTIHCREVLEDGDSALGESCGWGRQQTMAEAANFAASPGTAPGTWV